MVMPASEPAPEPAAGYGPWMQVTRKGKKQNRKVAQKPASVQGTDPNQGAIQGKTTGKAPQSGKGDQIRAASGKNGKGNNVQKTEESKGILSTSKGKGNGPPSGKSGAISQEWRIAGGKGPSGTAQAHTTKSAPSQLAGNSPTTPTTSPNPGPSSDALPQAQPTIPIPLPFPTPTKENSDPNLLSVSIRDHYPKKKSPQAPGKEAKMGIQKESSKKLVNCSSSLAKDKLQEFVKKSGLPLDPQAIADFMMSTSRKAEDIRSPLSELQIVHGRVTKDTYKYILENLDKRLSGWKIRSLSLAGRVTLALSVLNALPNYVMQTAVLPCHICDVIDKKIRNFVWGAEEGRTKIHLVTWETVCKPKEEGGLGLRSARALNLAYIMKLCWNFITDNNTLWIRILQDKYIKTNSDGTISMRHQRVSRLWKGMLEAFPLVKQGTIWDIRDGESVKFWLDSWVADGVVLKDYVMDQDPSMDWDISVADMADDSGIDPPRRDAGEDLTTWGMEADGKFRIKSAYTVAADWLGKEDNVPDQVQARPKWKQIWKWDGPHRIRHFLWLAFHNRLLTNCERKRRKFCHQDSCDTCNSAPESTEHVLRQCAYATQVWHDLGISDNNLTIGLNLADWMAEHLKNAQTGLLFGVGAWYLWKRRNEWVFDRKQQDPSTLVQRIRSWTSTVRNAQDNNGKIHTTQRAKTSTEIAWKPPPPDWIAINTDGSVKQPDSLAAAGGLLRDNSGRCLGAFASNLGACTITRAELLGVLQGLKLAWRLGYRKVQVRTDSTTVMSILTSHTTYEDFIKHGAGIK
ncbi:unnamed protein product [Linum tenue]|uniref:RNase H type-1 domain-containing protein n=1 Tax=Linum tenue TaxID=586396 RepID=A0AAV0JHG9_9ROSI|nr:unnamed protein product [Linum tenue]